MHEEAAIAMDRGVFAGSGRPPPLAAGEEGQQAATMQERERESEWTSFERLRLQARGGGGGGGRGACARACAWSFADSQPKLFH